MYYRYKLHELDGSEAGEAHYAVLIEAGETIWTGDGRKLRVVDVVRSRRKRRRLSACYVSSLPSLGILFAA